MIERKLEDILLDTKYLDPIFASPLINAMQEKACSLEQAWNCCSSFFHTQQCESLFRAMKNDHIDEDLKVIKPIIFLALYYYGKDFLYRSWITLEEHKDKLELEKLLPEKRDKYKEKQRKSRGQLYNAAFIKKLRGKNYIAKKKTDRVNNKVETYLKNILFTSYNHSNNAFNLQSSAQDKPQLRLEFESVINKSSKIKPLFQPELLGFIQKIYNLEKEIDATEPLLAAELPYEIKEIVYSRRTSRIADTIADRAKNSHYVTNYLSTMTAMIIDSLQCLSGHRNARGGLMTFEMINELDKIIREWIAYPYTEYACYVEQKGYRPTSTKEKLDTDRILINWAVEDVFKRLRFNTAIEKGFQCISDYKVDISDKNTQLKMLAACSAFLYFPLPVWPQTYLHDFELIEKQLANTDSTVISNDYNNALYRLFTFIGITFPTVVHIMCAMLFSERVDGDLAPDPNRISIITDELQQYLVNHTADYDLYDEKNIINIRNLKINADNNNDMNIFTTVKDISTFKKRQQAKDRSAEEHLKSTINQQLSLLKYDDVFKILMADKYSRVFWDEIFMRKRVLTNPMIKNDYEIDRYFKTQISTFILNIRSTEANPSSNVKDEDMRRIIYFLKK